MKKGATLRRISELPEYLECDQMETNQTAGKWDVKKKIFYVLKHLFYAYTFLAVDD